MFTKSKISKNSGEFNIYDNTRGGNTGDRFVDMGSLEQKMREKAGY
jgi:hypothetical protein